MTDRPGTRSMSSEMQLRNATAQAHGAHPHHQIGYNTRGLSELLNDVDSSIKYPQHTFRNTSEEMFIKSLVEGNIPPPNMEGIGLTNIPHSIRADSEELFHSWMSHGEGQSSGQPHAPHRSRQSSRRMSNELAALLGQQANQSFTRDENFEQFLQTNLYFLDDPAEENKSREVETGACTTKPPLVKPMSWFSQSHPMTRSRSSELRRRYAAMQGQSLPPTAEQKHEIKQCTEPTENSSTNPGGKRGNQPPTFPHTQQSSMPSFHMPLTGVGDYVSNFVTLLKGTIERKKLGKGSTQQQHHQILDPYHTQKHHEEMQSRIEVPQYQVSSPLPLGGMGHMQHEGHGQEQTSGQTYFDGAAPLEGFIINSQGHPGLLSHAPSPSESSVGAPTLSAGEDPSNSGHTVAMKRPARLNMQSDRQPKRQNSIVHHPQTGTGDSLTDGTQKSDLSKPKSQLTRVGSVTSSGGSGSMLDKEDPTKKRRVERQRKMAEAKGRGTQPVLPSDLQAALKRCDALEKEVRSLKLNLSFMNRKDSEQTKQIEELQKQNENLQEEKERLLEEIEHLSAGAYLA